MGKSAVIFTEGGMNRFYLWVVSALRRRGYTHITFASYEDLLPPVAELWVGRRGRLPLAPYGVRRVLAIDAYEEMWGVRVASKKSMVDKVKKYEQMGGDTDDYWGGPPSGSSSQSSKEEKKEEGDSPLKKREEAAAAKKREEEALKKKKQEEARKKGEAAAAKKREEAEANTKEKLEAKKKKQEMADMRKKPIPVLMEEKYAKTWRGENPLTMKSVGYWTVRGWLTEEDPKLKAYAKKVFAEFKKAVEEDKKKGELEEHTEQMGLDFGWPKGVINEGAFNLDLEKPITASEVEFLGVAVRNAFKTPGFKRGVIEQRIDKKISGIKALVKMVADPLRKMIDKKVKLGDKLGVDVLDEVIQGHKEVKVAAAVLAAEYTYTSILPQVAAMSKAPAFLNLLTSESITGALTSALTPLFPAGAKIAALTVPSIVPFFGGAPILASLVAIGVGAIVGKVISSAVHGKTKTQGYEQITIDIFTGEFTPEEMEAEYQKKFDALLRKKLPPEKLRKEILELYAEFNREVRPAIEKALYMMGKNQGEVGTKGFLSFLKTGASQLRVGASQERVLVKMRKVLDQFEISDTIQKTLNTKGFESQLTNFYTGKTKIPPQMVKSLLSLGVVKSS